MQINNVQLLNDLMALIRSAEMWVDQWRKHKDAPGVRNAAYALGKLQGAYTATVLVTTVPEALRETVYRLQEVWDELVFR